MYNFTLCYGSILWAAKRVKINVIKNRQKTKAKEGQIEKQTKEELERRSKQKTNKGRSETNKGRSETNKG